MRFLNAALGLAAVGAGLLVAGLLRRRDEDAEPAARPPAPADLIGQPLANKSAMRSAGVLEEGEPH